MGSLLLLVKSLSYLSMPFDRVAMRLWESEPPGPKKPESVREYEVVGFGAFFFFLFVRCFVTY